MISFVGSLFRGLGYIGVLVVLVSENLFYDVEMSWEMNDDQLYDELVGYTYMYVGREGFGSLIY